MQNVIDAAEDKSFCSVFSLSDEILLEICLYLNSEDLLSLSQSCNKFNVLLCERKLIRKVNCLSDEILLEICLYLNSEDLLSLSQSCNKFNVLLCERKLIRKVNFRAVYSLTLKSLKFFLHPQLRCKNIDTISLSSCYWLTSSDILWALQRLENLKRLHVDDTQLNIKHLTQILRSAKMIEALSWTFHMTKRVEVNDIKALAEELKNVKTLNLWIKDFAVPFLPLLLQFCYVLEDLRLSSLKFRDTPLSQTKFVKLVKFQLPCLKSLVLNLPKGSITGWIAFLPCLLDACSNVEMWHTLWIDLTPDIWEGQTVIGYRDNCTNFEKLFALSKPLTETEIAKVFDLENLKYLVCSKLPFHDVNLRLHHSKVSHLVWDGEILPMSYPETLEHLSILCNETHITNETKFSLTCDLSNLTKLSVPCCIFLKSTTIVDNKSSSTEESVFRNGVTRKSHLQEVPQTCCILNQFVNGAPNLEQLEIKCNSECRRYKPTPAELSSLSVISQWTKLQSLYLENIQTVDVSFLVKVAKNCPKLRRFGLKNVGFPGSFPRTKEVSQFIMQLEFLEDFRLEHPVVERLSDILEALSKKSTLCRVAIICKRTNTKQNVSSYINIVKNCPQLVFLYACISSVTNVMSKEFQKAVKSMGVKRPLWARLEHAMEDSFWEVCPSIHCNEMMMNPSCLNVIPPLDV